MARSRDVIARRCWRMAAALIVVVTPPVVHAQAAEMSPSPELRLDVIGTGTRTTVQGGAGLEVPAGYYGRIGVIAAAGSDFVSGSQQASGRLDVLARFMFDPFRQTRWGFSAGAGVSLRVHAQDRVRPVLLTVVDWEGPRSSSGAEPMIQLGLGGGVRIGAGIRWGSAASR